MLLLIILFFWVFLLFERYAVTRIMGVNFMRNVKVCWSAFVNCWPSRSQVVASSAELWCLFVYVRGVCFLFFLDDLWGNVWRDFRVLRLLQRQSARDLYCRPVPPLFFFALKCVFLCSFAAISTLVTVRLIAENAYQPPHFGTLCADSGLLGLTAQP